MNLGPADKALLELWARDNRGTEKSATAMWSLLQTIAEAAGVVIGNETVESENRALESVRWELLHHGLSFQFDLGADVWRLKWAT